MPDQDDPQKINPRLVAEIVSSYVSKNSIAVDQLETLIQTVHRTLSSLVGNPAASATAQQNLTPAVPIRRSIQPDHIVCLECGLPAKMLRRHLQARHQLDPTQYRLRWQLRPDYPLTAPAYSSQRSTLAKQIGLGRTGPNRETPSSTRRARRRPAATQ